MTATSGAKDAAPGEHPQRPRSIGRNVVAQVSGRLSWVTVSLLLTPLLFHRLGGPRFGVWSLLAGAVSIALLFDLGLAPALMRQVASVHDADRRMRARSALGIGVLVGGIGALLMLAVGWSAAGPLDALLHLRLGGELQRATIATAGAAGALALAVPFVAVLDGNLRMQLTAAATIAGSGAFAIVTPVMLSAGAGVAAPAVGLLAYAVVRGVVAVAIVRTRFREFWPRLDRSALGEARELMSYGAKVQASNVAAVVNVESDRWLLAGLYSTGIVAPYELGAKVTALPRLAATFALAPVFALASRAEGVGDKQAVDQLYLRSTRYLALVAAGCAAVLVACAGPIVTAWIGQPLPFARDVLRLLAPAVCLNICTGAVAIVVRAEGRPGWETRYAALSIPLNLALTVPLLLAVGPLGAIAGSAAAVVLASAYFFWYFHRCSGRSARPLAAILAKPWAAATGAALAGLAATGSVGAANGRASAFGALCVGTLVATLAYASLLALLGFIEPHERAFLRRLGGKALSIGLPRAAARHSKTRAGSRDRATEHAGHARWGRAGFRAPDGGRRSGERSASPR